MRGTCQRWGALFDARDHRTGLHNTRRVRYNLELLFSARAKLHAIQLKSDKDEIMKEWMNNLQ